MTRFRNRITGDGCVIVDPIGDSFGLVGVRYDDDPRTFFISPSRLVPVSDVLGEQVERELRRTMELGDAARAARAVAAAQSRRVSPSRPLRASIDYRKEISMTYVTSGARPYPHETPVTVHPGSDPALSEPERSHVRAMMHAHGSGISYALGVGDETAIEQGVPPTIRYRAMFWAPLHRAAMNAAHYFAMVKATDEEAEVAAAAVAEELRALILKQMPGSRESIAKIEKAAA